MLSGRVVIACIGNELRGDDGVGPFISRLLHGSELVQVVNCGETPENYLGVIVRYNPDRVIVIDAADFGGRPGETKAVRKADITAGGLSTHDAVLTLFADYIEKQTGAETLFLAIQPGQSEVGGGLSAPVKAAAHWIAGVINQVVERQ